jgi:hypothetical protein
MYATFKKPSPFEKTKKQLASSHISTVSKSACGFANGQHTFANPYPVT